MKFVPAATRPCERSISQMNILVNSSLPVLDVLVFFSYAILLIHRWVLWLRYSSNHEQGDWVNYMFGVLGVRFNLEIDAWVNDRVVVTCLMNYLLHIFREAFFRR